ncbi:MAG: hypothetical protein KC457_03425 [Myxococcales bacterium]|nr:hypothetical protein [Myxococcales bacterium]
MRAAALLSLCAALSWAPPMGPVEGPIVPIEWAPPEAEPPAPDPASEPELDAAAAALAIEAALDQLPASPSLDEVQRAALQVAGIDPSLPTRWRRRSRVAAALPTLDVQYDHRLDQGWTLDQEVGSADALRNDGQYQSVLRVKVGWELDRLVYSPEELRVSRAGLDLDDARVRVLSEVTALYFERRRLQLALLLEPPASLQEAIDMRLRLQEVEGMLAAATGLDFSKPHAAPTARIPPSFGVTPRR